MKRDVLDLVPKPQRVLERLRRIALGGALAGLGLFSTSGVEAAGSPSSTIDPQPALTASIVDRSKKTAKLILQLPGRLSNFAAQHRSHSSHSSHRSHSSGAGATVAPAPPQPRAVTPPPSAIAESVVGEVSQTAAAEQMTGKFFAFDVSRKTLIVRDAVGVRYEFIVRDDATLGVSGGLSRVDEYLRSHFNNLPYGADQSLRISWKPSLDGKSRVAVSLR